MHKTPPSAWENGLREAMQRLYPHVELGVRFAFDARDQAALAYILWRLRNAPDVEPDEPQTGPGRMTEERKAKLTPDEKIFYGIE